MSSSTAPALATSTVAQILYHFSRIYPYLPTYAHLLAGALFPIVTGAHASLSRPSNALPPKKPKRSSSKLDYDEDADEDEIPPLAEKLSNTDALLFPLMAGAALTTLWLIIRYASAVWLNKAMGIYFTLAGIFAVGQLYSDLFSLIHDFVFPKTWRPKSTSWIGSIRRKTLTKWNLSITKENAENTKKTTKKPEEELKIRFSFTDIAGYVASMATITLYYFWPYTDKPWHLTNILGTAFAYTAVQLLSPTSFPTASLILVALFFYDIFFVFYTPLMVGVATQLDVPIKMLFPRPLDEGAPPDTKRALAMLGLGDIVLPGIVMGLCLRFDLWRVYEFQRLELIKQASALSEDGKFDELTVKPYYKRATGAWGTRFWSTFFGGKNAPSHGGKFPKPYFYASIVGYILGMMTTVGIMHVYAHAQPALLYLVPGVLGSIWFMGLCKGELKWLWNWTEAEAEEKDDNKKADIKDSQNANTSENGTSSMITDQSLSDTIYKRWKNHKTINPSSTHYSALAAALLSSTASYGETSKLGNLVDEKQEAIYALISKLQRQEDGADNPFAYEPDMFNKSKEVARSPSLSSISSEVVVEKPEVDVEDKRLVDL